MSTFDEFCSGPFWNQSDFTSATWPKFTQCFQDTVLVWVPCGVLVLFAPCCVYSLCQIQKVNPLPISFLNAGKLFCQTTAAVLSLIMLLQRLNQQHQGIQVSSSSSYLADIIKIVSFTATAFLGQYERSKGVTASRLQLLFWFIMSLALVIPAYTLALLEEYRDNFIGFVIFYLVFALSVICFCLNCLSEHPSSAGSNKSAYQSINRPECPMSEASALSVTFFFWMFKLIRTGFKRDIEESDLWNLPQDMACDNHVPTFHKLWQQETERCRLYRKHAPLEVGVTYNSDKREVKALRKTKYGSVLLNEKTRLADFSKGPRSVYTNFLDHTADTEETDYHPEPSLIRVLCKQFWFGIFSLTWAKSLSDLFVVCGPLLLNVLLGYMANRHAGNEWQGYGVCVLMLLVGQIRIAFFNYSQLESYKLAMSIKSVLITVIYQKAMKINSESKKKSTVGDIVNLMSVDAQRIQEFLVNIGVCHTAPLQIAVSIALIYLQIGPSVLVGLLVFLLLIPLNIWIAYKQKILLKQNLNFKDIRIRMVNEILNGIKALKLYAWEESFHNRVQGVRSQEITLLMKIAILYAVTGVCWSLIGFLVTLATFTTFTLSDPQNFLNPGRAFMTLALFNILKTPLDFVSSCITLATQAYVSVKRINSFLLHEELTECSVIDMPDSEHAVILEDAELTWNLTSPSTLKNINLHIPQGKLVAIVGQVGSGKSSLISAILGDMEKRKGTITRKGTIAYVPQQAWIQNATVKDNITFGKVYKETEYKTILSACELDRDLTILDAGDQTEIGEKGINLSGGQKQRVSVARSIYQDRDLYLLDDPLSAVDSHVGKAIFQNVIGPRGLLNRKTRVLVTHGVHFLPQVDMIVVMSEGQISEKGTYEELLVHEGPFTQFLKTQLTQEQLEGYADEEDSDVSAVKDNIWERIEMLTSDTATSGDDIRSFRKRKLERSMAISRKSETQTKEHETSSNLQGKLVATELLMKGRVSNAVYFKYFKAAGLLPLCVSVTMFWCFHATSVGTNYWLAGWTKDPFLANRTQPIEDLGATSKWYLGVYALFGIVQLVFLIGYYYLFWTRMVMAGRNLHSQMTNRLFKAPMSFFDTTPVGRILNRCSRDIEIIDNFLPITLRDFVGTFGVNVITIIVIMIQTPIFGAILIPLLMMFIFVLWFYVPTARQLRRIEHVTRSPVYTHFSESISGAHVIRAYGVTEQFIDESKRKVDYNNVYFFAAAMAMRWLSVNLDSVANLVTFCAGIFQVLSTDSQAGDAGLTMSYALQITGSLPWMVRLTADFETNIVSVERIKEYSEIEQEAELTVSSRRPPPTWPSQGTVEFRNFSVRYREGLDLVVKGIYLKIEGGQKVGVVGRTGAGKSSLSLSLFRLMEAAGGCIMVDGLDISKLSLHDLRSRLTILPQDPVLFSGTLRMNLDPLDEFSDDDIWTALERAHLKQFVLQLPGRLLYECGEEGLDLSLGQRQLICLARTLLRKTKVLILDEATATVDMQTDTLIQNTIRMAFQNCTVIAIAHRLNTIMDYDKIMVLDAGLVKEYDTPSKLLENPSSIFYSMASDARLV